MFTSQIPKRARGWSRLKARARNSIWVSLMGPKCLSHHLLPAGMFVSREVRLQVEREADSNTLLMIWDVDVPSCDLISVPNVCPFLN